MDPRDGIAQVGPRNEDSPDNGNGFGRIIISGLLPSAGSENQTMKIEDSFFHHLHLPSSGSGGQLVASLLKQHL